MHLAILLAQRRGRRLSSKQRRDGPARRSLHRNENESGSGIIGRSIRLNREEKSCVITKIRSRAITLCKCRSLMQVIVRSKAKTPTPPLDPYSTPPHSSYLYSHSSYAPSHPSSPSPLLSLQSSPFLAPPIPSSPFHTSDSTPYS